jgi:DNA-binding transcriptional MocR family regulator
VNAAVLLPPGVWIGPDDAEARSAYARARELGLTKSRAEAVAHVASRDDLWAFARTIAERIGCSRRTVQRAFAQAKALGLMRSARGKKGEVPRGAREALPCGFCHRWVIGKGLAGAAIQRAVSEARARWLLNFGRRQSVPKSDRELERSARDPQPRRPPAGTFAQKLEWLDRELAELAERKSRDGPA